LSGLEPEVLDTVFSIGMRRLTAVAGGVSAVEGPTKEGTLKVSFGPDSWLLFHVENESASKDKAVEDLSIVYFKDGAQIGDSPFASRLVMDMVAQEGTWRIGRMVVTAPLNLFDKSALENLGRAVVASNESSAVAAIRWINTSEVSLATDKPKQGFTCDASRLAASIPASEGERIKTTVLKNGIKDGYSFKFDGCDKSGQTYRISAEPIRPGKSGNRSFCSDETGVIYLSASGKADSCFREKNPI